MNLYEAIYIRKTAQNFLMEPLDRKIQDQIINFTNYLTIPFHAENIRYEILDNIERRNGLGGIFSVKAPYYLTLTMEKTKDALMNGGCILEQIALYLFTKGIGSCFLEFHKIHAKSDYDKKGQIILVMPFGRSLQTMVRETIKTNRLSLEELCIFKEEADTNMLTILHAARMAPSALNNQPWRFVVYNNRIHVFCKKERIYLRSYHNVKQLDIGIMLAHLFIGSEEVWLNAAVNRSDMLTEKEFKKTQYICTINIKSQ